PRLRELAGGEPPVELGDHELVAELARAAVGDREVVRSVSSEASGSFAGVLDDRPGCAPRVVGELRIRLTELRERLDEAAVELDRRDLCEKHVRLLVRGGLEAPGSAAPAR